MKAEAYRCMWDSWGPQYHDDSDPMPEKWDNPPDYVLALVFKIDAEMLIDAANKRADKAESKLAALQARIDTSPVAIMDKREWLCICAPTEEDFPALYALQGKTVYLVVK